METVHMDLNLMLLTSQKDAFLFNPKSVAPAVPKKYF